MGAEVIVVGGGPVGLMTAALLDKAGVNVEVYERNPPTGQESKAVITQPRTLELLSSLALADGRRISEVLVELGRPVRHTHFATLPQLLDYAVLDTPLPFVLIVPQTHTERLLADYLREHQVPVHYETTVTGVEAGVEGVRVTAEGRSAEAAYLVGADGARSLVRSALGIEFHGNPPTAVSFGADVRLAEPVRRTLHYWNWATGAINVIPMPDGTNRLFGWEPTDTNLTEAQARRRLSEPLTLPELRGALIRIHGTDFGLQEASWLFRTSNHSRAATRLRTGRVFLVGDAAHVHLPAGGQGLNVGISDATNLAWKLAAELHGRAPQALRDGDRGYDTERRLIAAQLVANTQAQDALMNPFTQAGAALRDLFSDFLSRDTLLSRDLAGWLSGTGQRYPTTTDNPHPLTGTRAPNLTFPKTPPPQPTTTTSPAAGSGSSAGAAPPTGTASPVTGTGSSADDDTLFHALHPARFLLADFTPDHAFAHLATPHLTVRAAHPHPGDWSNVRAALIRPDGYVAHIAATPADLAATLPTWISPDPNQ